MKEGPAARDVRCSNSFAGIWEPLIQSGVNRGLLCLGSQRPLRWSRKHEKVLRAKSPTAAARQSSSSKSPSSEGGSLITVKDQVALVNLTSSWLFSTPVTDGDKSKWNSRISPPKNRETTSGYQLSPALLQDSATLVDCYSELLAKVLSIYDGLFNPFRAAALSKWRRSSMLFSTFKFFVNMYQSGRNASPETRLAVEEARGEVLGWLSSSLSIVSNRVSTPRMEILLVIHMFGLSSSWYDLDDLGLEHYTAAVHLVGQRESITPDSRRFFEEFLVYWWMMMSFGSSAENRHIPEPPELHHSRAYGQRTPHPLTGVSPESQLLLGLVGRLVLAQRRMALEHAMTTPIDSSNITTARGLHSRLTALQIPAAADVLDPGDPCTTVEDLLSVAEAYRICGLMLLYHCYPDLADNKPTPLESAFGDIQKQRQRDLASMAFQVLQLLESTSKSSGTRTIEAILLVILSGELPHLDGCDLVDFDNYLPDMFSPHFPVVQPRSKAASNQRILEARSAIMARFARIQAILPFKTIPRMQGLVLETWRLMDKGQPIFWIDLLIQSKWHFLMQ